MGKKKPKLKPPTLSVNYYSASGRRKTKRVPLLLPSRTESETTQPGATTAEGLTSSSSASAPLQQVDFQPEINDPRNGMYKHTGSIHLHVALSYTINLQSQL